MNQRFFKIEELPVLLNYTSTVSSSLKNEVSLNAVILNLQSLQSRFSGTLNLNITKGSFPDIAYLWCMMHCNFLVLLKIWVAVVYDIYFLGCRETSISLNLILDHKIALNAKAITISSNQALASVPFRASLDFRDI